MLEADREANAEPYACDVCDRYERDLKRMRWVLEKAVELCQGVPDNESPMNLRWRLAEIKHFALNALERPGAGIRRLRDETACDALRGPESYQPSCSLPEGHEGPHRWTR